MRDARVTALSKEWFHGVYLDGDWDDATEQEARKESSQVAADLAYVHWRHVAPNIHPTHVAREFVLDIDGSDIQLAGTIDVQEAGKIRDTKTSKKSPSQDEAFRSPQLTMYSMAV